MDAALAEVEKAYILAALQESNGVQAAAAAKIGISERSFWYRLKKLGIQVDKIVRLYTSIKTAAGARPHCSGSVKDELTDTPLSGKAPSAHFLTESGQVWRRTQILTRIVAAISHATAATAKRPPAACGQPSHTTSARYTKYGMIDHIPNRIVVFKSSTERPLPTM